MTERKFGDYDFAMEMFGTMRKIAGEEIQKQRPRPKYAVVDSVDAVNFKADVTFVGDDVSVQVNTGIFTFVKEDDVVRIEGIGTDRYIAGVNDREAKDALPPVSVDSDPNTLVVRDGSGRVVVGGPVNDNHAATKTYVDQRVRFYPGDMPVSLNPADFDNGITVGQVTNSGWPSTYGNVKVIKISNVRISQEFWSKTQAGYWVRTANAGGDGWGEWCLGGLPDTDWVSVNFRSGYESLNDSYPVNVRRIGNVVYMRGLVRPTSGKFSAGATLTVFDLPGSTYQPEDVHWAAGGVTNNDGGALVRVGSNGDTDIRIGTTETDWVGLGTSWVARDPL